jgi:LDH2 family malate/lactate/ureidoglycolate dehydrogenase
MRATPPAPGQVAVQIPGDRSRAAEAERSRSGIPLLPPVFNELKFISTQLSAPLPPYEIIDEALGADMISCERVNE